MSNKQNDIQEINSESASITNKRKVTIIDGYNRITTLIKMHGKAKVRLEDGRECFVGFDDDGDLVELNSGALTQN